MFRKALTLAAKDIKLTYRDRGALIGSYLAPIMILIIFGVIYSSMGDSAEVSIELLYVDQDHSGTSRIFLENLSKEEVFTVHSFLPADKEKKPLTEEQARELVLDGDYQLALVYHRTEPMPGFPVIKRPVLTLYYDPASDMERQITAGLVQKTAFMGMDYNLPHDSMGFLLEQVGVEGTPEGRSIMGFMDKWLGQIETQDESGGQAAAGGMTDMMADMVQLKTVEVVREEVESGNPWMANAVAGLVVMFLLFSVSHSAAALLKEQQEGTIKRLLLAPITVDAIIWGKFASIAFNSLCQLAMMLILSTLVFRVNVLGNLATVAIISIATVAAVTSFGMIISAVARSYDQIQASIIVIVLTMSAVGGSMFPRILMPVWMKNLGLLTINGWAIDGYLDALYRFNGPGSVLGYAKASSFIEFAHNSEALVLLVFSLICGWLAARLFKRRLVQGAG